MLNVQQFLKCARNALAALEYLALIVALVCVVKQTIATTLDLGDLLGWAISVILVGMGFALYNWYAFGLVEHDQLHSHDHKE